MLHSDENRRTIYSTADAHLQAPGVLDRLANFCQRSKRTGRDWKCECPICGKHSLSISSKLAVLVYCHHCVAVGLNDGYSEQRERFIDAGLLDQSDFEIRFDPEAQRQADVKRRAEATAIWNSGFLEPITPDRTAAKYLCARGVGEFIGHPALRCIAGALVARVWHVQHGLSAVQYTWLLEDGSDRDRDEHRTTKGVLKGGAVWINAPRNGEEVLVAEGLETLLSAMLLLKIRCGAAVLGPHFKDLVMPSGVCSVHIAADNDDTGRSAATHTARLWRQRGGVNVRVSVPDIEGEDFNDVWLRKMGIRS